MTRNRFARNLLLFIATGYFLLGVLLVIFGVRNGNTPVYVIAAVAFLIGVGHVFLATRRKKAG